MKNLAVITLSALLMACNTKQENHEPQSEIKDNLPIADRDLLLSPLETSMDDLAEITLNDASLDVIHDQWTEEGLRLSLDIYLNDADTQAVVGELSLNGNTIEKHESFFNRKGKVYKTVHLFKSSQELGSAESKYREYKFYFEDNGAQLSAYAKVNYEAPKKPDVWTPVCLTREEESFLANRVKSLRNSLNIEQ